MCPPALLQSAFDRLARTDLLAHLSYLDSVADYHERLKRHFFPVVFSEAPIRDVDWSVAPRHRHVDEGVAADLAPALSGVAAWTVLAAALAVARRRRLQRAA